MYATGYRKPFEVFARSNSLSYFDQVKGVLGVDSKEELQTFLGNLGRKYTTPEWGHHILISSKLCGIDNIASEE